MTNIMNGNGATRRYSNLWEALFEFAAFRDGHSAGSHGTGTEKLDISRLVRRPKFTGKSYKGGINAVRMSEYKISQIRKRNTVKSSNQVQVVQAYDLRPGAL
jgi:hypothetical protein